jgi:hypothetical protein
MCESLQKGIRAHRLTLSLCKGDLAGSMRVVLTSCAAKDFQEGSATTTDVYRNHSWAMRVIHDPGNLLAYHVQAHESKRSPCGLRHSQDDDQGFTIHITQSCLPWHLPPFVIADVRRVCQPTRECFSHAAKALLELNPCPEPKHSGSLGTSGDICVVLHYRLQR